MKLSHWSSSPWPVAKWVLRMQCLFIRGRWNLLIARLLFKDRSLRCCNWNTQIVGWLPPPGVPLQLWYADLLKRFWRQQPARKNSSRKGEKIKISKGMVLTGEKSAVMRLPRIFSFLLPRIQELSLPSRNPKGKQWSLILPAHQDVNSPPEPREEGREREA